MSSGKGGGAQVIATESTRLSEPITFWHNAVGSYPGNNLQWFVFKRPIAVGNDQAPKYFLEVFDPGMRNQLQLANQRAPGGHYVYNAFTLDRGTQSGIVGLAAENSSGVRPSCSAFFAGRAWFGGTNTSKFSSRIYFSQVLEKKQQTGYCYQQQDPTSETAPELLPNDGGVIVVPEMQQLIKLFPIGHSLLVMCSNGIWSIAGSQGLGFAANDYSVSRISDTPVLSSLSIIDVDGNPIFWNRSGIWMIVPKGPADFQVQSLTNDKLKAWFKTIPAKSKLWAKGAYNKQDQIVQWIFSSTEPADDAHLMQYDTILNLNILTGAFYPWKVSTIRNRIMGIFAVEGDVAVSADTSVVVSGVQVQDVGVNVVTPVTSTVTVDSKFKYIVNVGDPSVPLT